MLGIIGTIWVVVVGGVMLEESIRLELWLEQLARNLGRPATIFAGWMR
jgi:hypothetical protein